VKCNLNITPIIVKVLFVTIYSFISFLFHNGITKQKLLYIHYKTLRKAGLIYEAMKAVGFVLLLHNLNNMYFQIFFCHLAAVG
jgi:hypothetical protein